MSTKCEYCKKTFISPGNMVKHQKTAKFCIKIQKELCSDIENIEFVCELCNNTFSSKHRLECHKISCSKKYKDIIENTKKDYIAIITDKDSTIAGKDNEITKLKLENDELRDELKTIAYETELKILRKRDERSMSTVEEIAKQPKIQNNNKILITTPLDLSKESIQAAIQSNFSEEHLTLGQKGVAQFAYNNILKDDQGKLKYICTDPSRQIFQYKSDDGKIQKDVRATKLTKAILDGEIKQTSHKIAWDNMKDGDNDIFMSYTNHYQDIQDMEQDNSEFSKELSSLTV